MHRTTIHIRFSGVVYNTPRRSDIERHLCRNVGRTFQKMVNFIVNFKWIKDLRFPRCFRYGVTNSICLLNGFNKQISLYFRGQKFNLQRKFHSTNIISKRAMQVAFLPSTPSAMNGFPVPIL